MTIASLVEGATPQKGGIGIVGVPPVLSSTAELGHRVVLMICGSSNPGTEHFLVRDLGAALDRKQGAGTFGVVAFRAWTTWAFSPAVLWQVNALFGKSDFAILHSLYSFPVLLGYMLARLHRKPYGVWLHGALAPFQRTVSLRKKWLYDKLFARRILQQSSVLFFGARGEREEVRCLHLHSPSVIVAAGIDIGKFATLPKRGGFRSKFFAGHTGPLVLFLARLNAKKGLDLLAEAMAEVSAHEPGARLAIVGPPDPASFANQVQQLVHEAGIDSITVCPGFVSSQDRLQALADADVFVLPSHAENFGLSVFEAMASRIPVVVSDTLNYAGQIASSGAGFAVPRSADKFAVAILRLLQSAALRQQMGEQGFQLANSYSIDKMSRRVEIAINSVLNHVPIPPELTE